MGLFTKMATAAAATLGVALLTSAALPDIECGCDAEPGLGPNPSCLYTLKVTGLTQADATCDYDGGRQQCVHQQTHKCAQTGNWKLMDGQTVIESGVIDHKAVCGTSNTINVPCDPDNPGGDSHDIRLTCNNCEEL